MSAIGTGSGMSPMKGMGIAVLIALITVIFSLPYHTINVFDSGDYLRCAVQLNDGIWNLRNDFYAARLAAIVPYAAGIALFGFGQWLTYITLAEMLLLLLLVWVFISPYSKPIALITVIILSTSQTMLQCSSVVMGDTLLMLSANAVILLYFWFLLTENKTLALARKTGILGAIAFTFAFWTKESVMFFAPLMVYLFISDRKDILLKEFWKYVFGGTVLLLILTLIIHAIKSGDPLFRLHFMEHLATTTYSDYDAATFRVLLLRCTVQPFQFLLQDYTFGVLFLLSILHVAQPVSSPLQRKFKAYLLLTLITWWLGSQSIFRWNPMALIHRLWLPLLIPMAINGACGAWYFMQSRIYSPGEKQKYTVVIILFLIIACISLCVSMAEYEDIGRQPTGLILSTIACVIVALVVLLLLHTGKLVQSFHLPGIALVGAIILPQLVWQSISFCSWVNDGRPNQYRGEKELVEELKKLNPTLILTDAGLYRNYGIYDGFQQPLPFVFYLDVEYDSLRNGTYMLLNKVREKENALNVVEALTFARSTNKIPGFVLHPEQHNFRLLKENRADRLFVLQR